MQNKAFLLSLVWFLVFLQGVMAQEQQVWETKESAGYTYKTVSHDPSQSRFYTLKNGLTVILSPIHKEPRIQTYIAVKAGSKNDPATNTGLAHYLEHLLFKGTDKLGTLDYAKEKPYLDEIERLYETYNKTTDQAQRKVIYHKIDSVSGIAAKYALANEYDKAMADMGSQESNAFTSFEETVYKEDIPAVSIDKFLKVEAERFRNPVFRLFHTELEAVYEEKNRSLDNDGSKVFEQLFHAILPNTYGKQTTLGTVEHLRNPSLTEIKKYYEAYYVPNNMALVMAGDFDPDVLIKKIDEAFAFMKPKQFPKYSFDPEKAISQPIEENIYGPSAEGLTMGYRFPGASTRDAQLLDLLSRVLTNGKAGLIDLDLVKQQKLLNAGANAYALKDYSVLFLEGSPIQGQSLEDVKALLLSEIEKVKKGDFSEELLQGIVNNAKLSVIQSNENYSSRAEELMNAFTTEIDWRTNVAYTNILSGIKKQDIVQFANKYLGDNYVAVYKRKGVDSLISKIEKPSITPVTLNREDQSPFLMAVNKMPESRVNPVWIDFNKDINKSKYGASEVLTVQNKTNDIFRLSYRFNMGTYNNKLLSLATSYLSFLGTKEKSSEAYSKSFYQLASSFSVSASSEYTTVNLSGLNEHFDETISLFQELIHHAEPNASALEAFKARIKKGRQDAKLNKQSIMGLLRSYAMYGPKNPGNYTLSDVELEAVTSEQLIAILKELFDYKYDVIYYGPKTDTQLITDLTKMNVLSKKEVKPYPKAISFSKVSQNENKVFYTPYDMVQAEVYWVRNTEQFDPNQSTVIDLFNNYFGGGMGSVVFQTIRESKALAYTAFAGYSSPYKKEDRYSILAYVGTQADKMEAAITGMNELFQTLPVAKENFATAKESIRKDLETSRITEDDVIYAYLGAQRLGIDYDRRKKEYEALGNVTVEDVLKFHDREFKDKPFSYCIIASPERVSKDRLEKYGPVEEVSLETLFGY